MSYRCISHLGFALACLGCSVLRAQSFEMTPGVQLVAAVIQRGPDNLIQGRLAPGGALFMDLNLWGPHMLRFRADALVGPSFKQGDQSRKGTTWGIGTDYLFYVSGRAEDGLYLLLGGRAARYRDERDSPAGHSSSVKDTIGTAAGFGYTYATRIDLGVRWTHERVNEINLDSMQFVAGMRF